MNQVVSQTLGGLGMEGIFLLGLGVILAAVLRAFSGFGMALAIVPIAALLIPIEQAVVLSVTMSICVSISSAIKLRHEVDRRPMPFLVGGAAAGIPLGVYVLATLPSEQLRIIVGLVVMLSSIMLWVVKPKVRLLPRRIASLTGIVSGVLGGTVAMPGPPVIVYFLSTQDDPAVSRSSMMVYFLFANVMALAGFVLAGVVGLNSLVYLVVSMPFLMIGDKLGFVLFDRFGSDWYRKAAVAILFVIGALTIIESI